MWTKEKLKEKKRTGKEKRKNKCQDALIAAFKEFPLVTVQIHRHVFNDRQAI
jgi:hypothetical protein